MATAYTGNSHLPWWALIVSLLLASMVYPFVLVVYATTGFNVDVQQLAQMLGAALVPGNPQANLYFTLYGSNTVNQARGLAQDLKLGRTSNRFASFPFLMIASETDNTSALECDRIHKITPERYLPSSNCRNCHWSRSTIGYHEIYCSLRFFSPIQFNSIQFDWIKILMTSLIPVDCCSTRYFIVCSGHKHLVWFVKSWSICCLI
jgi:hypothetical protein